MSDDEAHGAGFSHGDTLPPPRDPITPGAAPRFDVPPAPRDPAAPEGMAAAATDPEDDMLATGAGTARERVASRRKAKPHRRWGRIVLAVIGALLVLAAGVTAGMMAYLRGIERDTYKVPAAMRGLFTPKSRTPGPPINIAVLGSDIRNYEIRAGETRSRSDTIMVMRIDPRKKKIWVLSFPRDMRVPIPGYGTDKINASYFYGGAPLVIETIKSLTGMPIHDYMEVNFEGFKDLVDAIGGVWINVPSEINDIKAANHDTAAMHIDPGYQKLDGKHALTFVRSRRYPTGDFKRIENQQKFMDALLAQTVRFQNVLRLPQMIQVFRKNAKTSMTVSDMTNLAFDLRGINRKNLQKAMVTGRDAKINGIYYMLPDEEKMAVLVQRMLDEEPFEGPATGGAIPNGQISIVVRNGSGVTGRGTSMGDRLKAMGFDVGDVGTAKLQNYVSTLVVYKPEHVAEATQVAKALKIGKLQPDTGQYSFSSDVLLVVGKDYVPAGGNASTGNAGGGAGDSAQPDGGR